MRTVLLVGMLAALIGCGRDVNVDVDVDSSAASGPAAPAPESPGPSARPEAPAAPAPVAGPVVSEAGFGRVQVGMTREAAEWEIGPVHRGADLSEPCRYLNPTGAPAGVSFMVFDGVVVRVDVSRLDRGEEVAAARLPRTAAGVGVGSTQAEVEAAYAGRVRAEPHAYVTGGRYLVVTPEADTTRRIVFETDERGTVTSLRAGRRPEVEWVEGCS